MCCHKIARDSVTACFTLERRRRRPRRVEIFPLGGRIGLLFGATSVRATAGLQANRNQLRAHRTRMFFEGRGV